MPFFLPFIITLVGLIRAGMSAFKDREFRALTFILVVLFISGMVFYHEVEGWRWLDALYFSVMTLTTVGYGDFTPHSDAAKIFTMLYVLLGLGILFGFVSLLAEHARENQLSRFGDFGRIADFSRSAARKTMNAFHTTKKEEPSKG